MSQPLLSIRGVDTYYGKIQALKSVHLDVQRGEIVTLIGANGAGKTTLMMTVCGEPRARRGQIVFDGTDITKMATHESCTSPSPIRPKAGAFSRV
jgi:branched-chain amino acid transport system ATP-binding protein